MTAEFTGITLFDGDDADDGGGDSLDVSEVEEISPATKEKVTPFVILMDKLFIHMFGRWPLQKPTLLNIIMN
jgi:hypothetical protein